MAVPLALDNSRPMRDIMYYMDNATFLVSLFDLNQSHNQERSGQVEDTLFKVPKRYFEKDSGIFSNILDLPADGESSDEEPLHLREIGKADFEKLLGVMYPA
jgi:hypothetical protein